MQLEKIQHTEMKLNEQIVVSDRTVEGPLGIPKCVAFAAVIVLLKWQIWSSFFWC